MSKYFDFLVIFMYRACLFYGFVTFTYDKINHRILKSKKLELYQHCVSFIFVGIILFTFYDSFRKFMEDGLTNDTVLQEVLLMLNLLVLIKVMLTADVFELTYAFLKLHDTLNINKRCFKKISIECIIFLSINMFIYFIMFFMFLNSYEKYGMMEFVMNIIMQLAFIEIRFITVIFSYIMMYSKCLVAKLEQDISDSCKMYEFFMKPSLLRMTEKCSNRVVYDLQCANILYRRLVMLSRETFSIASFNFALTIFFDLGIVVFQVVSLR